MKRALTYSQYPCNASTLHETYQAKAQQTRSLLHPPSLQVPRISRSYQTTGTSQLEASSKTVCSTKLGQLTLASSEDPPACSSGAQSDTHRHLDKRTSQRKIRSGTTQFRANHDQSYSKGGMECRRQACRLYPDSF